MITKIVLPHEIMDMINEIEALQKQIMKIILCCGEFFYKSYHVEVDDEKNTCKLVCNE